MHTKEFSAPTNARLIPKRQVAERFACCTKSIDRWTVKIGFPKPVKINGRDYYPEDLINKWVTDRICQTTGEAA